MASNRSIRSLEKAQQEKETAERNAQCQPEPKKSFLEKAHHAIHGERKDTYGPARENHQNIADLWSVILGYPVTPEQVVLCMIQVKAARLINSPNHEDSWVDIAGYVGVKDKMDNGL